MKLSMIVVLLLTWMTVSVADEPTMVSIMQEPGLDPTESVEAAPIAADPVAEVITEEPGVPMDSDAPVAPVAPVAPRPVPCGCGSSAAVYYAPAVVKTTVVRTVVKTTTCVTCATCCSTCQSSGLCLCSRIHQHLRAQRAERLQRQADRKACRAAELRCEYAAVAACR